ncbi:MAG: hypothetical protein Q9M25_09320 [Mariprofundaceae bacterium]|nr:hypothetical protein [Mariprofundaceae bacterium]
MTLIARLDADNLQQHVNSRLAQMTGQKMHSGKPSLSLLHGASLKLPTVRIGEAGDAWRLSADVVRINISLWSLLIGDLHFSAIDMIRPVLHLRRGISPQSLFAEHLPEHVEMLRIRHGRLFVQDAQLADNVLAVVRHIDRERQTTWEVESRFAGGDFSTQGYIRSTRSGQKTAFGRISATQLHMQQLNMLPLPPLHYDLFDTSLTFSFDADRQWQWSGNVLTHDSHDELPDLVLRGKVRGGGWRDFRLHDTLVKFGEKSRFQISGGCQATQACKLGIQTHAANAQKLLRVFAVKAPLSAKLDAAFELQERGNGWQVVGDFGLRHVRWSETSLPDVNIKLSKMHFVSSDDFHISRTSIKPVGSKGKIFISGGRSGKQKGFVAVSLNKLDALWVPLGNIVLQSYAWQPRLSGKGPVSGSLEWVFRPENALFGFDVDATVSDIGFGKFHKPAGMRAQVIGNYFDDAQGGFLQIGELKIGDSYIKKVAWPVSGKKQQSFVGSSRIDMDELRLTGLKLPEAVAAWHGRIEGGGSMFVGGDKPLLQRLTAADGTLHLNAFGLGKDQWSGKIRFDQGKLRTRSLRWQRGSQFADMAADVNLRLMRGKLDILRSSIAWSAADGLPDWLAEMQLRGDFAKVDLNWAANLWQGMHGSFSLAGGDLTLNKVRGEFAGGRVQSKRIRMQIKPDGVDFDARLRMSVVQLGKITGLANTLGADMDGYIFFNGLLRGSLPLGSGAAWRGNGDIEIHRGRWKTAKAAHLILWENESVGGSKGGSGERFSRLAARFHFRDSGLELTRLKFDSGKMKASGRVDVSPAGDIHGYLQMRAGEQRLATDISGRWPSLAVFFSEGARSQ